MRQPKAPLQESKGDGQVNGGTHMVRACKSHSKPKAMLLILTNQDLRSFLNQLNDEIKEAEEVVSTSLISISITRWCPRYCG